MLPTLLLLALLTPVPDAEPDGSRPSGQVQAFRAEPAPPGWLRAASHAVAAVDTRHYLYEVYAGPKDRWLVRYVMLPEGNEAFREIEQVFLFSGSSPARKPLDLPPAECAFDVGTAVWKGQAWALVERRDLLKP